MPHHGDELEQLSREDFRRRPLQEIAHRAGLEAPTDPTPAEEKAFRERAYESYALDLENRDEWGTATQATEPPAGEEPEL